MTEVAFSGAIYTDAKRLVECPRCLAEADRNCRTPSGHKKWPPHGERIRALSAAYPGAIKAATKPPRKCPFM